MLTPVSGVIQLDLRANYPNGDSTDGALTGDLQLTEPIINLRATFIDPDQITIEWNQTETNVQVFQYKAEFKIVYITGTAF